MAVQGHTFNGFRRFREWYEADVFGQIREIHGWKRGPSWQVVDQSKPNGNWHKPLSIPPKIDPIPSDLSWDLWLGPRAAETKYNQLYQPGSWRGFHQFGNGMLGDWFPHIADAAVTALDLYEPVVVECEEKLGGNDWIVPDGNRVRFEFKERGNKAPCVFYWYNGDSSFEPRMPKGWTWGSMPNEGGCFYIGDKQLGFTDLRSSNPRLGDKDAMRAFKADGFVPEKYPNVKGGPFAEWIRAIKGDGPEPGANFDYAAPFTEVMLIGVLAVRFGGRIEWDPQLGITNRPELNAYINPPMRKEWEYGLDLW